MTDKIYCDDMDFGTPEHSLCGICGKDEEGNWKIYELTNNFILIEDIICDECRKEWVYVVDEIPTAEEIFMFRWRCQKDHYKRIRTV